MTTARPRRAKEKRLFATYNRHHLERRARDRRHEHRRGGFSLRGVPTECLPRARQLCGHHEHDPRTPEEVNALTDTVASGNFDGDCSPLGPSSPCVNAGTTTGAPTHDYEGDPRNDGLPDVGYDELVPAACSGAVCFDTSQ